MTRLFGARRSAEHFQTLLESGAAEDQDRELTELLELVGALRTSPRPEARPDFVSDLRAQLMVAAETELVPVPAARRDDAARLTVAPRRHGARERRIGLALGTVAVMGATTSMAVASQGAIPGDTLYPLKRAIENTEAGVSRGDDAKGEVILSSAAGRLDEVGQLSRQDRPDPALITQTLETFTAQATEAGDHLLSDYAEHGDPASIQDLQSFTKKSVGTLIDLEATVPAQSREALLTAAQNVFALDALATNACPACGDPLLELPPELVNGVSDVLDDTSGVLGDALGGTPSGAPEGQDDIDEPSGLEPPSDPVSIPPVVPSTVDPTLPVPPVPTPGTGGGGNGGGGNGGGGGKGGGGVNVHTPTPPVDLGPVTDTVGDLLTEVLGGTGDVLGGVTGQGGLLGGGSGATPTP